MGRNEEEKGEKSRAGKSVNEKEVATTCQIGNRDTEVEVQCRCKF